MSQREQRPRGAATAGSSDRKEQLGSEPRNQQCREHIWGVRMMHAASPPKFERLMGRYPSSTHSPCVTNGWRAIHVPAVRSPLPEAAANVRVI